MGRKGTSRNFGVDRHDKSKLLAHFSDCRVRIPKASCVVRDVKLKVCVKSSNPSLGVLTSSQVLPDIFTLNFGHSVSALQGSSLCPQRPSEAAVKCCNSLLTSLITVLTIISFKRWVTSVWNGLFPYIPVMVHLNII